MLEFENLFDRYYLDFLIKLSDSLFDSLTFKSNKCNLYIFLKSYIRFTSISFYFYIGI